MKSLLSFLFGLLVILGIIMIVLLAEPSAGRGDGRSEVLETVRFAVDPDKAIDLESQNQELVRDLAAQETERQRVAANREIEFEREMTRRRTLMVYTIAGLIGVLGLVAMIVAAWVYYLRYRFTTAQVAQQQIVYLRDPAESRPPALPAPTTRKQIVYLPREEDQYDHRQ